ncbi:MAG: NAD(P)-dependent oxidoreductase [Acuticoccus sp.]
MTIAWIGVGNLATPIVERLVAAGETLVLCDVRPLPDLGAQVAPDAATAAAEADIVFSTLPSDASFAAVADTVFGAMKPDAVYCDMSTVSPRVSAEVAARAGERAYLRAPVSGTVGHARAGALTVFASGPEAVLRRVEPVFAHFASAVHHVGAAEEARVVKLIVNNLVGATAALLGESLALGEKAGLDWSMMLDLMDSSAAASPILKIKIDPMKARDYRPAFTTDLMVKDLSLVVETARDLGCDTPMAETTLALMKAHARAGHGNEDYFGVVQTLEERAGMKAQQVGGSTGMRGSGGSSGAT